MDPLTNLQRQQDLAGEILGIIDARADEKGDLSYEDAAQVVELSNELAELVQVLHTWRRSGGFDPYQAVNN